MFLERLNVLNSLSLGSELLIYVSSSNSNLASLALYTLLVFLLDFLGLIGSLGSLEEIASSFFTSS
jgi:hypothetical protein